MSHVCLYIPICLYTHIHSYAPLTSPYVQTPPYVPICGSLCSRGFLHVIWGCGAPYVGHPLRGVDTSPCVQHPLCIVCSPVSILYGIFACSWGKTLLMLGVWGVSMSLRLLVSISTYIGCPLCFLLCFLVVYYASSLYYHSYEYYSSSDCGVFWYVIYIISDLAAFLMGLPTMLGQHDVVLLPP